MPSTSANTAQKPLLVVMGPTASGKSDLAVLVATELAEQRRTSRIITADAYQIYRGMDIGTAKPSVEDRCGVPHELLDVVDPRESFTAHDWLRDANKQIAACHAAGEVPIVVGGTHLYIKLLVDGMFEGPAANEALRAELHALPASELRAQLERVDPVSAAKLHPNDIRRTVRAIEVFQLTGKPMSEHQQQWGSPSLDSPLATQLVVLDWPTPLLNRRINARVKNMMQQGLLDEVRLLHGQQALGLQAREGLGYKQLVQHLEGRCSLDEAIEQIKIQTRHFAKAQRTWLKKLGARPNALVLDMAALLTGWPWEDAQHLAPEQAAALLACKATREQAQRVVQSLDAALG